MYIRLREEGIMAETTAIDDLYAEIDAAVTKTSGKKVNIAYAIFKIIEQAGPDQRVALLQHLANVWDEDESSKELPAPALITENELEELKKRYGKLVDQMLKMSMDDNPPEDTFYGRLWELVSNPVFVDEKSRVFALYWTLIDKRIPYYHLDSGLRMSNEDWKSLASELNDKRNKLRFILAADLEQSSQRADLLLREILSEEDHPRRVRLMGSALFFARKQSEAIDELADLLRRV